MLTPALADTLVPAPAFSPEVLLARLAFPRENGTPELHTAHALLDSSLRAAGVTPESAAFSCQPLRAEAAACVLAVAAVLCARGAWRLARPWFAAAILAVVAALAVGAGTLDRILPTMTAHNLVARVEPLSTVRREILVSAHYDSKTEPLDHLGRGVLFAGAGLGALVTAGLGLRRWGLARPVGLVTAVLFAAAAAQLGLGRWQPHSQGVLDDGAACVLVAELAATVTRTPLQHTRLTCVWFAGEEVGAQGSAALAARLRSPAVCAAINLEAIGAGTEVVVTRHEMCGARPYTTPVALRAWLDRAAGHPLRQLRLPLVTDAGPLLRAGLPALSVLTMPTAARSVRGLHGRHDTLARFDRRGYDNTRALLRSCLAAAETPSVTALSRAAPAALHSPD